MTKYREIIRLNGLDFSARKIAESCNVSRNTVSKVLARAKECQIEWPLDVSWTDSRLEEVLFPKQPKARRKREPDYNYIRKELLRNGVNKKLLWVEYDCHKRIVKKMGCEDTRFHDLRHTYATACIKSGVDIKTLQDNLGHSDVQTTLNIYSHVFDSMKEASAHQVEAYYSELKKEK